MPKKNKTFIKIILSAVFVLCLAVFWPADFCWAQVDDSFVFSEYLRTANSGDRPIITQNQQTGAFVYNFPIVTPPGRNNLQPNLSLNYNSQENDSQNLFGLGWSINIPYIKRLNKEGAEDLYAKDYFYSSLSGELKKTNATSSGENILYGSEVDSGEFVKYEFINDEYWLATDKAGTVYKFGEATTTRQDSPEDENKIFKWMLEETRDTNDNYIKYEYYKDEGQIYPLKIIYTGDGITDGIFEIEFLRESRSDNAAIYETGLPIVTNYRIYEIQTKINGSWIKKYELDYLAGSNITQSMLGSIIESGKDDDNNTATMPATGFTYDAVINWDEDNGYSIPEYFIDHGSDTGVRVADVNGDGLPDLIRSYYNAGYPLDIKKVYINDGDGWVYDSDYSVPEYFFYNGIPDTGVRLADVNGDGLIDIIRSYNDVGAENDVKKVYINNGNGTGWTYNSNYNIPEFIVDDELNFKDIGVRIFDVNSDGLPDFIRSHYNSSESINIKKVYINNGDGTGWTETGGYSIPEYFVYDVYNDRGIKLGDVNGDGLVDVIRSYNEAGTEFDVQKVYINDGDGSGWTYDDGYSFPVWFWDESETFKDRGARLMNINGDNFIDFVFAMYDGGSIYKQTYTNNGDGTGWTLRGGDFIDNIMYEQTDQGVQFMDVNGDTMDDVVISRCNYNGGEEQSVHIFKGGKSGALTEISDRLGAIIYLEYKGSSEYVDSSGNLLNTDLPYPLLTINNIVKDNGLTNLATTTFEYEGGDFYYNGEYDRELAGFNKITKADEESDITKIYYHQGNDSDSTKGEYEDDISKLGKPYRTEIYDDSDNLYSKTINKWENYDLGNDRNFVKLTQTVDCAYDGDEDHKDKATVYDYDDSNGNLTQKIFWGEVTGGDNGTFTDTGSDISSTTIEYAASTTLYILGAPSREITNNQNGNKVKETKYYYDNLSAGQISKGNLTKQEEWKSGSDYIDTERTYNSYGLVTQEKDSRDKATDYVYDQYNLYIATSTNPLGQTAQYFYDYSSGKVKKTINPNNRIFETVYDGLDRPAEEKQPDIDAPASLVTKKTYYYGDNVSPRYVKEKNYLSSATSTESYIYLDGFDRVIQIRNEAEETGVYSVKDIIYNGIGLIEKESLPYFSIGASTTAATASTSFYAVYTHNPLKRITTTVNSVGTTTNVYDQWAITITDPEDNCKSLYKDAYDNLTKVEEHNGASTYTTEYDYDLLSNLTAIEDAMDNIRNFAYDGLGRLLVSEDLHAPSDSYYGTTIYVYDDAGNITSKTDAKAQTINYAHDDINRVLTGNYTGSAGTETSYAYDNCAEGIGRLCAATSTGAVSAYEYNALGLASSETKIINSTDYTTSYDYDRQGNIILITNPDGAEIKYEFNSAGQPERIFKKESGEEDFFGIAEDYDYNAAGQTIFENFSNDVDTSYIYDENELYRLKNKYTIDPENKKTNRQNKEALSLKEKYINSGKAQKKADGSVKLYIPEEKQKKNSNNSKTSFIGWDNNGKTEYETKFYGSNINYFDETQSKFLEINTSLIEETNGWKMEKADYKAKIKKNLEDDFIEFNNKGQKLSFSLIEYKKENITAVKTITDDQWTDKQVIYKNGLGDGVDIKISLNNEALIKEAVINDLKALGDLDGKKYFEILFKLTSDRDVDVKIGDQILGEINLITDDVAEIIDGYGVVSYVWAPVIRDSAGKISKIEIEYKKTEDGIIIAKRLPVEWLKTAKYPIIADAIISCYSNAGGDGYLDKGPSTWSGVRNAVSADWAYAGFSYNDLGVQVYSGQYYNERLYFPFSLSSLPAGADVASAYLSIYHSTSGYRNDDNLILHVVQSGQANLTSLAKSDYDNLVFTSGGNYALSEADGRLSANLNETALGWVESAAGNNFMLAQITDNDLYNSAYSGRNFWRMYMSNTPDSYYDPYLSITYTINNNPSEPGDLKTEGQTNPQNIKDFTPEFSAIYNDEDSDDNAIYYHLQVSASSTDWHNLLWDTGTTTMATTTEGNRCDDIAYGGAQLEPNGVYYWRIKFWDDEFYEGEWSTTTAIFIMVPALQDLSYIYDKTGNIVKIIDSSDLNSAKTTEYTYDDLYRLTVASTTNAINNQNYRKTYSYNAIGNITNSSDLGEYSYNGNQGTNYALPSAVTNLNGSTYVYDNNGNLTSNGIASYSWTHDNRLASSSVGQNAVSYGYDYEGNRVKMTVGGNTTITPNKYYSVIGATTTKNIFANGRLIATIVSNGVSTTTQYIHTDHLNGTNVVTNENGYISQLLDYYPFGDIKINEQESSFDESRKFTGHIHDDATDLEYMVARYYDGNDGRFISIDPAAQNNPVKFLSDPQQLNSYSYARNNPVNLVDPTGLTTEVREGTGEVMNVINDNSTRIYAYAYNDAGERVTITPSCIGNSYRTDTFSVGDRVIIGKNETTRFLDSAAPQSQSLAVTAYKSLPGHEYDIKKTWGYKPNDGVIIGDKYATMEDAGNMLAGLNAKIGGADYNTFQRMAGGLHQAGWLGAIRGLGGKEYGPAPYYGEIERQYWASQLGYGYIYYHNYMNKITTDAFPNFKSPF